MIVLERNFRLPLGYGILTYLFMYQYSLKNSYRYQNLQLETTLQSNALAPRLTIANSCLTPISHLPFPTFRLPYETPKTPNGPPRAHRRALRHLLRPPRRRPRRLRRNPSPCPLPPPTPPHPPLPPPHLTPTPKPLPPPPTPRLQNLRQHLPPLLRHLPDPQRRPTCTQIARSAQPASEGDSGRGSVAGAEDGV